MLSTLTSCWPVRWSVLYPVTAASSAPQMGTDAAGGHTRLRLEKSNSPDSALWSFQLLLRIISRPKSDVCELSARTSMTFRLSKHLHSHFHPHQPLSLSISVSLSNSHTRFNNWSEATFDLPHLVANYQSKQLTNNYSLHFCRFHYYSAASIFT